MKQLSAVLLSHSKGAVHLRIPAISAISATGFDTWDRRRRGMPTGPATGGPVIGNTFARQAHSVSQRLVLPTLSGSNEAHRLSLKWRQWRHSSSRSERPEETLDRKTLDTGAARTSESETPDTVCAGSDVLPAIGRGDATAVDDRADNDRGAGAAGKSGGRGRTCNGGAAATLRSIAGAACRVAPQRTGRCCARRRC